MANKAIGIDAHAAEGRLAGLGVFARHWVRAMKTVPAPGYDLHFFTRKNGDEDLNTPARLVWENFELARKALRDKISLLHVPAFAPPLAKKWKLVVTVHDLIGMAFANQLGAASAFYWGQWLPFAVRKADAIIADSLHTQKDIVMRLGIPEKKIWVIYPGVPDYFSPRPETEIQSAKTKFGIQENYFLFVGTLEPRKNLKRTLEAFRLFLNEAGGEAFQMVVVGSKDFAHGRFYQELSGKLSFKPGQVQFTGYVSHEELNALYSGAAAFLYPSLYEGFGFPVLEAMSAGAPVLTSNTTSIPEVAGAAASLVNPESEREICEGMKRLAADKNYRTELVQKGFQQIQKFSWSKAAQETLQVYRELL